jgi:hypothetical protein
MNEGINYFIKGFEYRINLMKHNISNSFAYIQNVLTTEEADEECGKEDEKCKVGRKHRKTPIDTDNLLSGDPCIKRMS